MLWFRTFLCTIAASLPEQLILKEIQQYKLLIKIIQQDLSSNTYKKNNQTRIIRNNKTRYNNGHI